MHLFFIVFAGLYLLGNVYIYFRSWELLHTLSLPMRWILSIAYWAGCCSFFGFFGNRGLPEAGGWMHVLYYFTTSWLVFTLYMVLLLLFTDVLRLFHVIINHRFIICFSLTLIVLACGYLRYSHPDTKVINININKPVEGNKHLRVVAVSDIHLGYGTNKARLQHYLRMIKEARPDLILISGDLIDSTLKPVAEERMEEELRMLEAPLGVYMVPGNHEYISGTSRCREFISGKTSISWLQDSTVVLPNGIQLVGRDDRSNRNRVPLPQLTRDLNPQYPILLLDHQPYQLEDAVRAGVDLQFSGHTHHGQVWPLSLLTDYLFEVSHGYKQLEHTHIYVSSGLSLWGPPFRIGTQSELVIFELNFK